MVTVVGGWRLAAGGWHSRARVSVFSGDPAVLWHLIQVRLLLVSAISTNGCAGVPTPRQKGGRYNGVACGRRLATKYAAAWSRRAVVVRQEAITGWRGKREENITHLDLELRFLMVPRT